MTREGESGWTILRRLRAEPPKHAGRGDRRQTFGAALSQAEELWRASASVGPTTSPMLLFYSLNQAARASCAATVDGDDWRGRAGHGLQCTVQQAGENTLPTLEDVVVRDAGRGLVHLVAKTAGSPTVPGGATLHELVHALPEREQFLLLDESPAPTPIHLYDHTATRAQNAEPSPDVYASVGPLPAELVRFETAPGGHRRVAAPTHDEVRRWFERYPRLREAGPPAEIAYVNPMDLARDRNYAVELRWVLSEPILWGHSGEWFRTIADVVISDPVGAPAAGLALPAVGTNDRALHPLVGWWLVLYALSMIARYHPRTWVAMLNVDRSAIAVPLERILDTGRHRIPALILDQILG